jgi:hypothetical protein
MRDQWTPIITKIKTSALNVTKQQACMYVWNPDQRLSLKKFLFHDLCPLKTPAKRPGIPPTHILVDYTQVIAFVID